MIEGEVSLYRNGFWVKSALFKSKQMRKRLMDEWQKQINTLESSGVDEYYYLIKITHLQDEPKKRRSVPAESRADN